MVIIQNLSHTRNIMAKLFTKTILYVVSAFALTAHAESTPVVNTIDDFTAKYNIVHGGDIKGKAVRKLKTRDNGDIEFSYRTDIEWMIFSDHRNEETVNQVVDGVVIPKLYISSREGTGSDKYYGWSYDYAKKTATNLKKKKPKPQEVEWPEGLQSKLSFHLQSRFNLINNRKNFNFEVISTNGKIKNYNFEYIGKEDLMLPYGNIEAIKLKRKKPDSKQVTYVWFAPSLNYLMVKLYLYESDFKQFHAELVSVSDDTIKTEVKTESEVK